jgi:ATP-dependent DNA helicase RecQ
MQDQVNGLHQLGVRAAFLNSSLDAQQRRELALKLHSGEVDLLYVAPERLASDDTLTWLQQIPLSVIAIDEAHCVSQWGHDFRTDYLLLNRLKHFFQNVPRVALTATANQATQDEICTRLELESPSRFTASFDRPNIHYVVQPKRDSKRQLLRFLQGRRDETGVIYCLSRKKVESTAQWLSDQGYCVLPYHAGLEHSVRNQHLSRFLREDGVIVVATIAFGMGIDKPDVRFVCHLDLPKSMEAYYQETGRAGRDGEPATAWMIYSLNDVVQLQQMVESGNLDEQRKRLEREKLNALLGWSEIVDCRRKALLAYFGETMTADCGNCDNCAARPAIWDATVPAQKLLSCIYRTGQRFGFNYVLDVLKGRNTDRIVQNGHQSLSTFGIGNDLSDKQWRSVLRQLIVKGFAYPSPQHHGAIFLTNLARGLLKSEHELWLRRDTDAGENSGSRKTYRSVTPGDRQLWDRLRQCRKEIAESLNIPAYQVFHDATLMEMMEHKPSNKTEMLAIAGVGETKFERFGQAFLELINELDDFAAPAKPSSYS